MRARRPPIYTGATPEILHAGALMLVGMTLDGVYGHVMQHTGRRATTK